MEIPMIKYMDYLNLKDRIEKDISSGISFQMFRKYGSEIIRYRKYIRNGWEFIEEYKGNEIFKYEELYAPYIGCNYGFKTIEDCKKRIDNSNASYIY
jgi:hypothetical protein